MTFFPNASDVYRDHVTKFVPSSGEHAPALSEIRTLLTSYEAAINALGGDGSFQGTWDASVGTFPGSGTAAKGDRWIVNVAGITGGVTFGKGDTLVAAVANASATVYASNWVVIPANTRVILGAVDGGAGTANAIQVTTDDEIGAGDGTVVTFQLFEDTTSSPVTVSIDGGPALTLKTNRGNNASALTANMEIWGRVRTSDSTLRMMSDQDVSALVAQAEDARDVAVAAAAALSVNAYVYETRAQFEAATIPLLTASVTILGYYAANDMEPVRLKRLVSAPGSPGLEHWESGNGLWFELVVTERTTDRAYGARLSTDSSAAVLAMAAHTATLGVEPFVRFGRGGTLIATDTIIPCNLKFDTDAYISTSSGVKTTVRGLIYSDKQFIFQGDGTYEIVPDNTVAKWQGTRFCHVSWFGALPGYSGGYTDSGVRLQKLTNSFLNNRECFIVFDVGVYWFETGVVWNRASKLIGAGDRMTNIMIDDSAPIRTSGNLWDTNGDGVQMDGFQFNCWNGTKKTSGYYVKFSHDRCKAKNLYMDSGWIGVGLGSSECTAENIKGLSWSTGAGTCVVEITANNCTASDVDYSEASGTADCEAVVYVNGTANTVSRPIVTNVRVRATSGTNSGYGVMVKKSSTFAVSGLTVDGIKTEECKEAFYAALDGSGNCSNWTISNVTGQTMARGINIELLSTGSLFDLVIVGNSLRACTSDGIRLSAASTGVVDGYSITGNVVRMSAGAGYGIDVAGAGSAHSGGAIAGNTVSGTTTVTSAYRFKATGFAAQGNTAKTCSVGYTVALGSDRFLLASVNDNCTTALSDASGAVTKSVSVL